MVGHYLLTLTEEQEDRVLTREFNPVMWNWVEDNGGCGGCLIMQITSGADGIGAHTDELTPERGAPGFEYEDLVKRFGLQRVNAAIRARILTNRLWRTLQNSPQVSEVGR